MTVASTVDHVKVKDKMVVDGPRTNARRDPCMAHIHRCRSSGERCPNDSGLRHCMTSAGSMITRQSHFQNHYRCNIYCDCGAVVSIMSKLLDLRPLCLRWWLNKHADIWNLILRHIHSRPKGCFNIHKLCAHQRMEDCVEKWLGNANAHVGSLVRKYVRINYQQQVGSAASFPCLSC